MSLNISIQSTSVLEKEILACTKDVVELLQNSGMLISNRWAIINKSDKSTKDWYELFFGLDSYGTIDSDTKENQYPIYHLVELVNKLYKGSWKAVQFISDTGILRVKVYRTKEEFEVFKQEELYGKSSVLFTGKDRTPHSASNFLLRRTGKGYDYDSQFVQLMIKKKLFKGELLNYLNSKSIIGNWVLVKKDQTTCLYEGKDLHENVYYLRINY